MIGEPPICMWCKHYHRSGPTACDAFSEQIPDEIWYSCNPHTEPFPGDHGVQFELDPDRDKIVRLPAHYRRHLRTRVSNPYTKPFSGDHGIQFKAIDPPTKATRVKSRRR